MKSKIIKAQFNELCIGGILLDQMNVALFSGENGMTALEVTPSGINIQPGSGNALYLNTLNIKGPMHKQSNIPGDFLTIPILPRKTFDFPLLDAMENLTASMCTYATIAGAVL